MPRLVILIQQAIAAWTGALSAAGNQGVFNSVHYLIVGILNGLALVHIVFAVYFLSFDIMPMVIINVVTFFYYTVLIWYKVRDKRSHDLFIALIVLEVCVHAALATYYIGWDSGFSIYLLTVSVILAVISSSSITSRLAAISILAVMLIVCDYYFSAHTPMYELSQTVIDTTRRVNYANALLQLAIAAMGYQYLLAVANAKMDKLANEDQLTGQLNRRAMIERSEALIERCHASRIPVCAAIGDLDFFKKINDSYGHAAGDEVLVSVSKVIQENRRLGDLSARWGGEEFVWLFPNSTQKQTQQALNRLRKCVQALSSSNPTNTWQTSISIGFTQILPNESYHDAITRADMALYHAKESGRNRVEFKPIELSSESSYQPSPVTS